MNIYSNVLIFSIKPKTIGIIPSMSLICMFIYIYYNIFKAIPCLFLICFGICICNILIRIALQLIPKSNFSIFVCHCI